MASSLGWVEGSWDHSRAASDQVVHSGESFFGDKLSCNGAANPWGHHHDVQSWDLHRIVEIRNKHLGFTSPMHSDMLESILQSRNFNPKPQAAHLESQCPKCHTLHSQSFQVR